MNLTLKNWLINFIQERIESEGEAKISEVTWKPCFPDSEYPFWEFSHLVTQNNLEIIARPAYAYVIVKRKKRECENSKAGSKD